MQLLLDTHTFLWWVDDAEPLSRRARSAIADPRNACVLSLASCWEMAIKVSLRKLRLPGPIERFIPEQLARNGFRELPIELDHIARTARLVFHHRDPFDRILVAQTLAEDLAVVSADPVFRRYGVRTIW